MRSVGLYSFSAHVRQWMILQPTFLLRECLSGAAVMPNPAGKVVVSALPEWESLLT